MIFFEIEDTPRLVARDLLMFFFIIGPAYAYLKYSIICPMPYALYSRLPLYWVDWVYLINLYTKSTKSTIYFYTMRHALCPMLYISTFPILNSAFQIPHSKYPIPHLTFPPSYLPTFYPLFSALCSLPSVLCLLPSVFFPLPSVLCLLPLCPMLHSLCLIFPHSEFPIPHSEFPIPHSPFQIPPSLHSRNSVAGGCRKTILIAGSAAASAVRIIKGSDIPSAPQSTPYRKVQPNDCRLITYTSR